MGYGNHYYHIFDIIISRMLCALSIFKWRKYPSAYIYEYVKNYLQD